MTIVDQLRAGITTSAADETHTVAAELALVLEPDSTLALHGNLGVGKTTFVQGLARGFGVEGTVTSPTFNIYTVHPNRPGKTMLVHLDAYRLENARQIEDLLVEDFLVSPWCLAIEWPEKIASWVPESALHLDLGIAPDQRHTLRLRS